MSGELEAKTHKEYDKMADHDLLVVTATKMDGLGTRFADFVETKAELCKKHETRMGCIETKAEDHEKRLGTLETYFKVLVGATVVFVGVFGTYVADLLLTGGH